VVWLGQVNRNDQLKVFGAEKIAMGITTVEEVLKVVPPDSEI